MADLSYRVRVDTQQATRSIQGLQGALAGLATAVSLRELAQFADAVTNIQNRLRTLTPSTRLVEQQFAAISNIARNSRSDLTATGDLYFRIARASNELGISLATAAEITDTLSKGMSASGLSAAEAAGPLLQIGQALQSGRFQGDELRSVLEGMPIVSQALAQELGVSVGELRKLGSEGRITGEVFVRAMQNSREAIQEAFGRTLPTISQSFEVLETSVTRFVGEFDRVTGTSTTVAQSIQQLATAIDGLRGNMEGVVSAVSGLLKILTALGAALLIFGRAIPAVGRLVDGLKTLRDSTRAAGGATGVLGGQLAKMRDNITSVVGSWTRLIRGQNTFSGAVLNTVGQLGRLALRFTGLTGLIYGVITGINDLIRAFTGLDLIDSAVDQLRRFGEWLGLLEKRKEQVVTATQAEVRAIDNAIDAYNRVNTAGQTRVRLTDAEILALNRSARAYYERMEAQQADLDLRTRLIGASQREIAVTEALMQAGRDYAAEAIRITDAIADARAAGTREELAAIPTLQAQLAQLSASYNSTAQNVRALTEAQQDRLEQQQLELFATQRNIDVERQLDDLRRQTSQLTMTEIQRRYDDITRSARASAQAAIEAEQARRGSPLATNEIEEYYRAAEAGSERLKQQTQELYDKSRQFSTGWQIAINEYVENISNGARNAQTVFSTMTTGMERAIDNFVRTGKLSFKSLIQDIVATILKSQVQQLIASVFAPKAGGGIGNAIGDFFAGFFADGGRIPAGQFGVVGERGPELVSGPATVTPMTAGGGSTVITYNINAVDVDSFRRLVASDPQFIFGVTEQGRRSLPTRR